MFQNLNFNAHKIMPYSNNSTAPAINDIMVRLSGQISPEIYSRGLNTSVWLDLPKQESWPEGMGTKLKVLTMGRSLPKDTIQWEDIAPSDSASADKGGACIPPVQRLELTNKFAEYNLQQTSLESPDVCLLDLVTAFQAEQQLTHMMEVLTENTRQVWINRNRAEYIRLCPNKFIATDSGWIEPIAAAAGSTSNMDFAKNAPTSALTGGHLKRIYARAIRSGAGKKSYGTVDGRPTFMAITGMETSEMIAQATEYRQDLRWSDRVPELLSPLGIEKMFKGFWLADDVTPPRYNTTGTGAALAFVEVPPYIWNASGELVENPAYETAAYEDTIIFHQEAVRHVVMPPAKNFGQLKFDPQSYRGDWKWLNIQHRTDNPDGNYGFFRGVFASGTKPVFPQYGFVIRHKRCNLPIEASACAA